MAFVEHQPGEAAAFGPAARRVDHHQRVIGDHQIGLCAGPCRAFDEAAAIMRAGGIDTLAAPVGQPGKAGAAKQRRQPARQIAANHVAIARIFGPAFGQPSKHRRTPAETALHRVFQVEQAQIILAALAHHHLGTAFGRIGPHPRGFGIQLALQGLGEGRHPHGPLRLACPQRRWRQITQRLTDARPGFGQNHLWRAAGIARRERCGGRPRIITLAVTLFRATAHQPRKLRRHGTIFQRHHTRRGARWRFLPLGQQLEHMAFGRARLLDQLCQMRCPCPALAAKALQ